MKQPFNNIDEDTFSQLANHIEAELEKNHLSTALNLLSQHSSQNIIDLSKLL